MTPPTSTIDPRVARTRAVVVEATSALLCDDGFERITIDSIAERSGVARSTIYRNWPDRHELLLEGFEALCAFPDVPDDGSLESDLRGLGRHLARGLSQESWGRVLPSLVGAAEHDPELKSALQVFNRGRREAALAIVHRAADRGEVDIDRDIELAVIRFASAFFFTHLFTGTPLDDEFVERVVTATVTELTG